MIHANWRRRAPLLSVALAGLLILPGRAPAQPVNEFRAAGAGLACITEAAPQDSQMPSYRDCLRIGPVRIGETLRDVAMRFGKAAKEVRQGPVTLRVWPVRLDVPAGTSLPYWVIGFDEDRRVVSIQLTGDKRNPLERIIREVRRRTRVVGSFPDGHAALMLVAARLRHVSGSKWGTRRYLDMTLLRNRFQEAG